MRFAIPWLRRAARRLGAGLLVLAIVQALFLPVASANEIPVFPPPPDVIPPTLVSAEVNGTTLVLTYSEALVAKTLTYLYYYRVLTQSSSQIQPVSGHVSGSQVTLTLPAPVSANDDTVRITQDTTATEVTDLAGNAAGRLYFHPVTNNTPDLVAPLLSEVRVNGNGLVLTYNEALDTNSVPDSGDFTVTVDGAPVQIASVTVTGWQATLTLAEPPGAGTAVLLSYTPGTNPLQDAAGNGVAELAGQRANNPPTLLSQEVNGDSLVLTFNTPMQGTPLPATSEFSVRSGSPWGSSIPVTQVAVTGAQVTLTLESPVSPPDALYVSHSSSGTLADLAGNAVGNINSTQVTNNTVASLQSARVDGSVLTLLANMTLKPDAIAAAADFAVTRNGDSVEVTSVAVAHRRVTLTLAAPVAEGDVVTVGYTPGDTPLEDYRGTALLGLTGGAVTNDTIAPGIERHVGADQTYATIEEALAVAEPGDIITVHAGTYRLAQTLVLDDPGLTLRAASGEAAPEVTHGGMEAIDIRAHKVTVEGLHLTATHEADEFGDWYKAILIWGTARGATVRNNVITGDAQSDSAIYAEIVSGALNISGNVMDGNSMAIYLEEVTDAEVTIADNTISQSYYGIGIDEQYSSDLTVSGNQITGTDAGIYVWTVGGDTPDSNSLVIANNEVGIPAGSDDTTLGGSDEGIYVSEIDWAAHVVIEGNSVIGHDDDGLALEYLGQKADGYYGEPGYVAPFVEVKGNTFKRNDRGIYQYDTWDHGVQVLISENIVQENQDAGFLSYYDLRNANVQITNNEFSSNGCGIVYDEATIDTQATLTIQGNEIKNNTDCGVSLYAEVVSEHVSITGNTITGNQADGLYLHQYVQNVAVAGNEFGNNATADITLRGQNNRITGNRFNGITDMPASISIHVDTTAADNQIAYNEFLGGNEGIRAVEGTPTVDASLNWWGDTAGPGASLEASAVMGDVTTSPWITGLTWTPDSLSLRRGASEVAQAAFTTLDSEGAEGSEPLDLTAWPLTSSDAEVAQAAADGTVTGVAPGTATLSTGFSFDPGLAVTVAASYVTITAADTETREATVTVSGTANPGAVVTVGDTTVTASADGTWSAEVSLEEGVNIITATNDTASQFISVTRDTTPPQVTLTAADEETFASTVTLTATTEDGAALTIAGEDVGTGSGTLTVDLEVGSNTFTATATDGLGNEGSAIVTVVRKRRPAPSAPAPSAPAPFAPAPSVTISAAVTETREATVTVSGTANPGAVVSVGGTTATASDNGTWTAVVTLVEGVNTITATNGAASQSITVTRDSTPPAITLTAGATETFGESTTLTATTEEGATLTIAGADVGTGSGSLTVTLVVGSNTFTATATDKLGNEASATVTVVRQEQPTPEPVEADVDSTEESEVTGADWSVSIPAGAAEESFRLSVSPPADNAAVDQVQDAAVVAAVAEIKAQGKSTNKAVHTFKKKLKVTFHYDPSQFPDPSRLAIHWYDPAAQAWVSIGGVVDPAAGTITAEVDHFTLFAVLAANEVAPALAPLPAITDKANLAVTGQAEAGSTVTLVLNGAKAATATADDTGAYSFTTTLQAGRNLLYVKGSGLLASSEAMVTYAPAASGHETPGDGTEVEPNTTLLTDVSGHWAEAAIVSLVQQGIISGFEDQTYRPELTITRVQFTALVARALGLETSLDLSGFTDAEVIPDWARADVAAAVAAGIVQGRADGSFDPDAKMTRAEAAVMLARALRYRGVAAPGNPLALSDFAAIPQWAQASVEAAVHAGIISGYEDGTFRPDNLTTRAEVAIMLSRLLEAR